MSECQSELSNTRELREAGVPGVAAGQDNVPGEWIALMAAGDQAALARLYDATSGRVHALAFRVVRDAAMAEEVVSDVYFQAWRSAASFDASRASVTGWLLMICRSRALDALRARPGHASGEAPSASEEASPADPAHLLECMQGHRKLRECLAGLEPMHRQLVALAFFRGYSHADIAARCGLPLGTVKSAIRNAMRRMRSALQQQMEI